MGDPEGVSSNQARQEAARALCDISTLNKLALADGSTPTAVRRRLLRFVAGVPMPPPPPRPPPAGGSTVPDMPDRDAGSSSSARQGGRSYSHKPQGDLPIKVYIRRPL